MAERTTEMLAGGLCFGEGPRWHEGRLWFSDQHAHTVSSISPAGEVRLEFELEDQPSGLGWLPDGRLLVVAMTRREVLRREADGSFVRHGDLRPWATWHANDMVVDATGRAYVGNFGFDLDALFAGQGQPHNTSMIRVDPDGSSYEAADDLAFPNGTVIFPDGRTLVVGESMGLRLTAFTIGDDGGLSDRRVWAEFEDCAPDGICLDTEGCIWVANAMGTDCRRIAEGGRELDRITTSQPCYACMLGGEDRRTLFCMTAPTSEVAKLEGTRDGRIETAPVEVPGAGLP